MTRNRVDVIIISDAKNEELYNVTRRGLDSLMRSSIKNTFTVVVIESQRGINYDSYNCYKWDHKVITHHPEEEFGYNKYLNIGIKMTNSPYVALCNSDLTFKRGWSEQMIFVMEKYENVYSCSPWCPILLGDNEKHIFNIYMGYEIRKELAGWCIFQKRELYDIIGELNTDVDFWYSDNIYADELKLREIKHVLVPASVVKHHNKNIGKTAESLSTEKQTEYTTSQYLKYVNALNNLKKKLNVK